MKIIDIVKFTVMLYVQYIIIVRENGNKTSCTVYVFLILLPLSQNELLIFFFFLCGANKYKILQRLFAVGSTLYGFYGYLRIPLECIIKLN